MVLAGLMLAACSSGTGAESNPDFEPAYDCAGLADRWVDLQQEYLDRLGDADAAEFEAGSPRMDAAISWLGQALIEQGRDVRAVGCEAELVSGSEPLCSRLEQLDPGGGAGIAAIDLLRNPCPS